MQTVILSHSWHGKKRRGYASLPACLVRVLRLEYKVQNKIETSPEESDKKAPKLPSSLCNQKGKLYGGWQMNKSIAFICLPGVNEIRQDQRLTEAMHSHSSCIHSMLGQARDTPRGVESSCKDRFCATESPTTGPARPQRTSQAHSHAGFR